MLIHTNAKYVAIFADAAIAALCLVSSTSAATCTLYSVMMKAPRSGIAPKRRRQNDRVGSGSAAYACAFG
jgi:hypothetical protein